MKKHFSKLYLLLPFLACFLFSCKDDKEITTSTPIIGTATLTPSTFNYGDSVTLTVDVSDPNIKLSTLETKITIGDTMIDSISIRTKGNSTQVSKKIKIPFVANSVDGGQLKAQMQLININGDVSETKVVTSGIAKNPITSNDLYMFLKYYVNGTLAYDTITLQKKSGFVYASPKSQYVNGSYIKIADNKDLSKASYIWEKDESALAIGDGTGDYLYYSDALFLSVDTMYFNASSFGISYGGINLANITKMDITFKTVSSTLSSVDTVLVKDKQITFHNINATLLKTYANQDYFEYISDGVYKFKGVTGYYTLKMENNSTVQYMTVFPDNKTYPDALTICGEGIGAPTGTTSTSWWGFDEDKYFYCMKTGTKKFQLTCYLRPNSTDYPSNFKIFQTNGWTDVTDYDSSSSISSNLNVGSDRNIHLNNGEPGGKYLLEFDLSNSDVSKNSIKATKIN